MPNKHKIIVGITKNAVISNADKFEDLGAAQKLKQIINLPATRNVVELVTTLKSMINVLPATNTSL